MKYICVLQSHLSLAAAVIWFVGGAAAASASTTTEGIFCSASGSDCGSCYNESCGRAFEPHSPLVLCSYLPREFMVCDPPLDVKANETLRKLLGHGCTKYGGTKYEEVQRTPLFCRALDEIECYGNRTFLADMQPCIKYSGHYFVTTLLYSVLLGFLGVDRFCLGYTGAAVGKLLTLGGVGVWWFVDIILLVLGQFTPEDKSNWNQYY